MRGGRGGDRLRGSRQSLGSVGALRSNVVYDLNLDLDLRLLPSQEGLTDTCHPTHLIRPRSQGFPRVCPIDSRQHRGSTAFSCVASRCLWQWTTGSPCDEEPRTREDTRPLPRHPFHVPSVPQRSGMTLGAYSAEVDKNSTVEVGSGPTLSAHAPLFTCHLACNMSRSGTSRANARAAS